MATSPWERRQKQLSLFSGCQIETLEAALKSCSVPFDPTLKETSTRGIECYSIMWWNAYEPGFVYHILLSFPRHRPKAWCKLMQMLDLKCFLQGRECMICMMHHDAASGRAVRGAEGSRMIRWRHGDRIWWYKRIPFSSHMSLRLSNANAFKLGSFSFLRQCWDTPKQNSNWKPIG